MTKAEEQDVALKILHTADWHLGLRFPSFGEEDGTKLTRARIEAVDRLLGIAESYTVNAVLCAGDIFDTPAPEEHWWKGLIQLFQRRNWSDRPVFLLPGNHDPLQANSAWSEDHAFRRALPPWVHVVDRNNYEFPLSEEAVLYAEPCRSQAGADDLSLRLPLRTPGDQRIRIGLALRAIKTPPARKQAHKSHTSAVEVTIYWRFERVLLMEVSVARVVDHFLPQCGTRRANQHLPIWADKGRPEGSAEVDSVLRLCSVSVL